MKKLSIVSQDIPVKVYRNLRITCGLSPKTQEASEIGLSHSIYSVMIKDEKEVIGMGRIIGDGGCFCQIVDICVHPSRQGRGLGKLIMQNLMDYIQAKLPESCYISLIADGDAAFLYEKFGFKDTRPASKGMYIKR